MRRACRNWLHTKFDHFTFTYGHNVCVCCAFGRNGIDARKRQQSNGLVTCNWLCQLIEANSQFGPPLAVSKWQRNRFDYGGKHALRKTRTWMQDKSPQVYLSAIRAAKTHTYGRYQRLFILAHDSYGREWHGRRCVHIICMHNNNLRSPPSPMAECRRSAIIKKRNKNNWK